MPAPTAEGGRRPSHAPLAALLAAAWWIAPPALAERALAPASARDRDGQREPAGNYELSLETRARSGFLFRVFGGAGVLMNRGDYECAEGCGPGEVDEIPIALPYFGFGLGAAFDG